MNITRSIVLALALAWTATASARVTILEVKERAAEVSTLVLTGNARQVLYLRECDQCAPVSVSLTPQTLYYDHRTPVDAATAGRFGDRSATVFYDDETRTVTRIVFWKKVTS